MKKKSTVGISGITPFKQDNIQNLLSDSIGKFYGIWKKFRNEPFYFGEENQNCFIDLTAGDMDLERKTSPFTFISTLRKYPDFPAKLYLIEKDKTTFRTLRHNVNKLNLKTNYNVNAPMFRDDPDLCSVDAEHCKLPPEVFLKNVDLSNFLGEFGTKNHKYRYGLLYYDPNGFKINDYRAIFYFIKNNERMDIIININAIQIKRNAGMNKIDGFKDYCNVDLIKVIEAIHKYKKFIYIRNNIQLDETCCPKSHHKFILVYGTNNPKFIMNPGFNFVSMDSKEGKLIIIKYNYGNKDDQDSEAVCQPV